MTEHVTRRQFVQGTALTASAAAAATVVPRHVLGGPRDIPPSEKMNVAGIGVGGMGAGNLRHVESENIVALCDVDENYAGRTFAKYPDAKRYVDYREMLDKQKDIDGVVIATPDHTHAVISMAAIRAGKHVYCQKPLTHDVYEARMLAQAAREAGVATQMGIQGHSGEGLRLICEWVWAGLIGEVREVDAWCSLTYYPWGHASWSSQWGERPEETPPVPAGLDWDLWIGPAPMRPYHRAYHPRTWRCWWDFGSGMMGDRGAHTFDPIFWALKLGAPESIDATTCGNTEEVHPLSAIVTYRFPARGDMPPVKLNWFDGGLKPPRPKELEPGRRMADMTYLGEKGTIMGHRLIPETAMAAYGRPPKTIPPSPGHDEEWVAACRGGPRAGSDFVEHSGLLTEACLLANVAVRSGKKLEWDGPNLKITNDEAANKLLHREYREGWSL